MKKYLAELIGSLFYITITSFAIITLSEDASILIIALISCASLTTLIYITQPISGGHINPIFTIGSIVSQKINLIEGIIYILMQVIGAIIGTGIAIFLNSGLYEISSLSTQIVDPEISIVTVVIVELSASLLLTLIFLLTSQDEDSSVTLGICMGVITSGLFITCYLVDQIAFIPTKTLAVCLYTFDIDTLSNMSLFIAVPIFGAILAGIIAKVFE